MLVQETLYFVDAGDEVLRVLSMTGFSYNKKEPNASLHHCV